MSDYRHLSRAGWIVLGLMIPVVLSAVMFRVLERPSKPTGRAADIERELRKEAPEILIIGSSVAGRDVQRDLLAKRLGVPEKKVTILTLPNSAGAHWYAILKNRVYANGYKPDVVLTVSALGSLATNGTMNAASEERLINQLGPDEPVIAKKIFGLEGQDAFNSYYRRERASALRDMFTDMIRNHTVWVRYTNHRRGFEEGGRRADAAAKVVFADENMNYDLHQQFTPGLAVNDVITVVGPDYVDPKTSSVIPDFVSLAHKHGAKVVFVRVPFPPSNPDEDYIPDDIERATIKLLEKLDVGYLDMRTLNLDDSAFEDPVHLSPQGARRFTEALATALKVMHVRRKKPNLFVQRPVRPTEVRRVGEAPVLGSVAGATAEGRCGFTKTLDLPPLTEIEDVVHPFVLKAKRALTPGPAEASTCSGEVQFSADAVRFTTPKKATVDDLSLELAKKAPVVSEEGRAAYWVYPGTTLQFVFDKRDRFPADRIPIFATARSFGEGDGVPTVSVGDASVQMQGTGDEWRVSTMPATPDGEWSVSVSVPEGGSYLLLDRLVLGRALTTSYIVGAQEEIGEASVRLVGGYQDQTGVTPEFAAEPVAVPGSRKPERYRKNIGLLRVPEARPLADGDVLDHGKIHRCSPFKITENGTVLPNAWSDLDDLSRLGAGRSTHLKGAVYFTASDTTDPLHNGRTYRVILDPERRCSRRENNAGPPLRDGMWLYPTDVMRIAVPPDELARLIDGVGRIVLEGSSFLNEDKSAQIRVRLLADGIAVLDETVATTSLRPAREWTLPTPANGSEIALELTNLSAGSFLLVSQAFLAEVDQVTAAAPALLTEDMVFGDTLLSPVRLQRTGTPTARVNWSGRRKLDDGSIRGSLPKLTQVSNTHLQGRGLGPWSPLVLFEDGEPMTRLLDVADLANCTGCFVHKGSTALFMRGKEEGEVVGGLTEDFPMVDAQGNRVLWVYPGTTLEVSAPAHTGALTVAAEAQTFVLTRGRPLIRVGDDEAELAEGEIRQAVVQTRTEGPVTIEIASPADGPFVMLTGLWMGQEVLSPLIEPPAALEATP